ncbi:cold-shock protein [Pseudomonas fluorescens]|uniref:Cold-shock protein n=1 Tax=Pseudomonas fluorescens TaxID=294 RepID=A0A0F4TY46_PSEFL|nr:cold shock domain-containing protein [Pseudomonas fluorescens]KJZ49353.1 cold-shock protein [Pseudomonas fluorescens]
MATGVVKWFDDAVGTGLIIADEGGQDLFAHFRSICGDGSETLSKGQRVEFEIVHGPNGLQADLIRPLQDPLN